MPLSSALLHFTKTREDGRREIHTVELSKRISAFEEHIKLEENAIKELQMKWETIVGEIWKCGEDILGSEGMNHFLIMNKSRIQEKATDVDEENSLFVPEEGYKEVAAVVEEAVKSKKKVSFKDLPPAPQFLTTRSALPEIAFAPKMAASEIESMEEKVENLGAKHIDDLQKLYRDQHKWYKMKSKKIRDAVMHDD